MKKHKIKYYTVTEGYDWGPSISKLILKFEKDIKIEAFQLDEFEVTSKRCIPHDVTGGVEEIITPCPLARLYRSDIKGNETMKGAFLTLSLEVGPDLIQNSPFHYSSKTGVNTFVDIDYQIQWKSEKAALKLEACEKTDKLGNSNLLCEAFDHNQKSFYKDIQLQYASFTPKVSDDKKVPLIIWLHGAGEGGTDTRIAVLGNRVSNLVSRDIQSYFGINGAYVLVPQTQTMWMDVSGESIYNLSLKDSDGHSYYTEALMALIETYVNKNPAIDRSKIYLGGCSNGGYMTIQMLVNYPDFFAAGFPIAQAYHVDWLSESRLDILKNIPLWLVHAKNDPAIPIHRDYVETKLSDASVIFDPQAESPMLDHFSNALFSRLRLKDCKKCYYSLFENVVDTSGTYFNGLNEPYEYHGHFSWIYVLNDSCRKEIDGKLMTLLEWLSKQSK